MVILSSNGLSILNITCGMNYFRMFIPFVLLFFMVCYLKNQFKLCDAWYLHAASSCLADTLPDVCGKMHSRTYFGPKLWRDLSECLFHFNKVKFPELYF